MPPADHRRIWAVDAFRGLTVCLMILVNNPGSWQAVYAPLRHAPWDGLTFADVVFPFFLWIMGVSISISSSAGHTTGRILRRGAGLFAIGLAFNFIPDLNPGTVRIPGVLQRIAICYLFAAILHKRGVRAELFGLIVSTSIYAAVMLAYPVPGFGAGRLDTEGNAARFIDAQLLGGHLWMVTKTWDPEGIVSTLTALGTTILGLLAGRGLDHHVDRIRYAKVLIGTGAGGIAAGWLISFLFPVNKNLWSPSYMLLTAGMAGIVLGVGVLWENRTEFDARAGGPFLRSFAAQGKNPLLLYVISVFVGKAAAYVKFEDVPLREWAFRFLCQFLSAFEASLAYAVMLVMAFALFGLALEKRRVFIRL